MKILSLKRAIKYLETATIDQTRDIGSAYVLLGKNSAGMRFVMVNEWNGGAVLIEFK